MFINVSHVLAWLSEYYISDNAQSRFMALDGLNAIQSERVMDRSYKYIRNLSFLHTFL